MDSLDRVVRIGLLFDQYAPLLTGHQREAIDLYYLQNWSLQEIAEAWSTSRQAVHDLISRTVRALEDYESRLGLEARERATRSALEECARAIREARAAAGRDSELTLKMLAAVAATLDGLLNRDSENETSFRE